MSDNLVDDIFEPGDYEAEAPEPRNLFQAWHHPRKQYVREKQWCCYTKRIVRKFIQQGQTLKYLGLPGNDFLDLRQIHADICEELDIKLKFLGFNSGIRPNSTAHADTNISLDEVRRLRLVDHESDVILDDFKKIAVKESIAWDRTKKFGPFDVINLDLCDGFGASSPCSNTESYYDAINSLFSLQARRENPWVLFLTTRADKQNIDLAFLEKLIEIYVSNLDKHSDFLHASFEKFEVANEQDARSSIEGSPRGLSNLFLVGVCKWMLSIVLSQNPPTKLELESVLGYKVKHDSESPDLISLALKFTPTDDAQPDTFGIATKLSKPTYTEETLAIKALNKVSRLVDVDSILEENRDTLESMIILSSQLLEQSRYSADEYVKWVREGCP